jgi:hypothetical protein
VKTSWVGFRGKDSFGSISVYEESDGSMWARITLNGVVLSYEQISYATDLVPVASVMHYPTHP